MKAGATVILRNAKIDMFKDTMRMAVDKSGLIQVMDRILYLAVTREDYEM